MVVFNVQFKRTPKWLEFAHRSTTIFIVYFFSLCGVYLYMSILGDLFLGYGGQLIKVIIIHTHFDEVLGPAS